MSRTNIFQISLEPDDVIALKRQAEKLEIKPSTLGRLLLVNELRAPRLTPHELKTLAAKRYR